MQMLTKVNIIYKKIGSPCNSFILYIIINIVSLFNPERVAFTTQKYVIINIMNSIGAFLKSKRQSKGLSLRGLTNIAGVNHCHIRNIEQGIKKPGFEVLKAWTPITPSWRIYQKDRSRSMRQKETSRQCLNRNKI